MASGLFGKGVQCTPYEERERKGDVVGSVLGREKGGLSHTVLTYEHDD